MLKWFFFHFVFSWQRLQREKKPPNVFVAVHLRSISHQSPKTLPVNAATHNPHAALIRFLFLFFLSWLFSSGMHPLKKKKKMRVRKSLVALQQRPACLNTNGGFMSRVEQDGAPGGRGGVEVRPCCHGAAEARRVPRPFPLVQIGWCFQPSRARKWRVFVKGAPDEKQIGKEKLANMQIICVK